MLPESRSREHVPYVGFPIVWQCGFECTYCQPGGETSASTLRVADTELVIETARIAHSLGSRKFRITGGEPFLHKELGTMLFTLSRLPDTQITVNTTGIPIIDRQGIISNTPKNVRFIISLDSLDKDEFNRVRVSKAKDMYERVINGIHLLAEKGILKRLNTVVTKDNMDGVFKILDFCRELECHLKVSDVAENIGQFKNINEIYAPIDVFENELAKRATQIEKHEYTEDYGIPCNIYHVDGVKVTVKNSRNGARYNLNSFCGNCKYFPCHEGLYFISALPDGSFSGCRLDQIHISDPNRVKGLKKMMEIITDAELIKPDRLNT